MQEEDASVGSLGDFSHAADMQHTTFCSGIEPKKEKKKKKERKIVSQR